MVALCSGAAAGGAQSSLVIHWVDANGNPACNVPEAGYTLHVSSWLDGVTQTAIQGADLVVDSLGWCSWPDVDPGVYTLEALPWSWTFVVDWELGRVSDTVTLVWPDRPFQRLRGNPGPVRYSVGHPGSRLDSLQLWMDATMDSLDLDQLVATGSVGGGAERGAQASANLKSALNASESFIDAALKERPHTLWGDLWESRIREWRMSLGASDDGGALSSWLSSSDTRSWSEKLASPGWCSSWELTHDRWWEELEEDRRPWRTWVATGDVDSLCHATGWSLDELHVALWMGQAQPWKRWADAWWELRWKDQCEAAEVRRLSDQTRRHLKTAQAWSDVMWMMPNGDLEPAWAGENGWRVWLITRTGSATGARERAILRSWMNTQESKEWSWGVLSVDANEEGWTQTLRERESVHERVRWVGRDPGWWDRLELSSVPQVVVVRPDGEIQTHHASLPSEGLFADLKRWKQSSR